MTTQQRKEEAIKKAYEALGANWDELKGFVDYDNGCLIYGHGEYTEFGHQPFGDFEKFSEVEKGFLWRPISLSGIDDNNGWTLIEPDGSNLPEDETKTYILGKFENGAFRESLDELTGTDDFNEYVYDFGFTHYRTKEIHPSPIF